MNKNANNLIAFRLPDDQTRELRRLATLRRQSGGKLARDIVTAALIDYSRFDELNVRLRDIERALEHLIERADGVAALQSSLDEMRASLATVTTRLLVETGRVPLEEAVGWIQEAFQVGEPS